MSVDQEIEYFNNLWKNVNTNKIPKDSDTTTKDISAYKNFSGIEKLIEEFLQIHPFYHKSILSVGCGAGKDLQVMRKLFPLSEIYGIDTSRHALIEAKKYSNASLVCAAADYLPFRDDVEFDGFIAGNVLDLPVNARKAEKIIQELDKHAFSLSRFYMTFYWNSLNGKLYDGECPEFELNISTPVGNALTHCGWQHMHSNDYSLLAVSPYAEGEFWVESTEKTSHPVYNFGEKQ